MLLKFKNYSADKQWSMNSLGYMAILVFLKQ